MYNRVFAYPARNIFWSLLWALWCQYWWQQTARIISVCCSNIRFFFFFFCNDSRNTWTRHSYKLFTLWGLCHHKNEGHSTLLTPECPSSSGKKDFSVTFCATPASENCSFFPRLFLEWHYWMLCCCELSIELSFYGYKLPRLADFLLS